jgi:hypothetical protein
VFSGKNIDLNDLRGQMNLINKRAARTVPGSIAFKLSPVAAGCAVFMALASQTAYAQETSGQDAAATGATNSGYRDRAGDRYPPRHRGGHLGQEEQRLHRRSDFG